MSGRGRGNRNSRGVVVQTQQRPKQQHGRKPCPQGFRCPYIDEYQHSLEFSHDSTGTSSSSSSNKRNFDAFVGTGHRLGSGGGDSGNWWGVANPVHEREGFNTFYEDDIGPIPEEFMVRRGGPAEDLDMFFCDTCQKRVPLSNIEEHLLLHTQTDESKSLRNEQDTAYEESILEEVKRRTAEEAAVANRLAAEQRAEQQRVLRLTRAESKRDHARSALLPEPTPSSSSASALSATDEKVIAIRFTFPSGKKIVRKFKLKDILPQMYYFLLCQEELFARKFLLRGLRQEDIIDFGSVSSLEGPSSGSGGHTAEQSAASVTENSAYTVVLLDDDDDNNHDSSSENNISNGAIEKSSGEVVAATASSGSSSGGGGGSGSKTVTTTTTSTNATTNSTNATTNTNTSATNKATIRATTSDHASNVISLLDSAEKPPLIKKARLETSIIDLT